MNTVVRYLALIIIDKTFNYIVVTVFNIRFDSVPINNIFFLFGTGVPICFNLIFCHTLLNIYWRLQSMRDCLKIVGMNFKEILKSQSKIYDSISLINRLHTPNLVFTLLDMLIVSISSAFMIYDVLTHSLTFDNFVVMTVGFAHFTLSALVCLAIIFYSCKIEKIQNEIIFTLAELQMKSSVKYWKRHQVAICQFDTSKNEVSCGLFTLDFKQIFVMLSSFSSFLIVMIQFDLMIEN